MFLLRREGLVVRVVRDLLPGARAAVAESVVTLEGRSQEAGYAAC